MSDTAFLAAEAALLLVLVFLSAYASSTETAITSLTHGRLKYLINTHHRKRRSLSHLLNEPNDLITTLLVLNNLVNVAASTLMTLIIIQVLPALSKTLQGLVATGAMTVSLLVFGEITPKNFAKHNAERFTLATINQVHALAKFLRPVVFFFRLLAKGVARVFGVNLAEREPLGVSDEQIETLIDAGEESGLLAQADGEMIRRILDFDEVTAEQVMVPRPDVESIEVETSMAAVRALIAKDGHSRFPVYDGIPDNVVGTLYAKDLLGTDPTDAKTTLRQLLRPAHFVPTTQPINVLLRELQRQKVHMAVVIDEFGGMAGIVTLEDILEEIVGEIEDEYDEPAPTLLVKRVSRDEAIVSGDISIHDLNRAMDIDLPEDEGVTVNGLIQHRMNTLARAGDRVKVDGVTLLVERASDREVTRARVVADRAFTMEAAAE
ncbi:MAG: hemolysin family protein [Candidatus Bipolaricaulis sp.]|nr:hemolysin family protein [Candidatus Bipolaricaulis sp.]MDD5646631.1 hemolysin family protein [Candidatus Bipolaricaulis sp.]